MENLDRLFPQLEPTTTTTSTKHQPDTHPSTPTLSSTATALPKREPVDLAAIRQQIRENMEKLDRLFPPSTLTTTKAPPTRQPDVPLLTHSLSSATEPELSTTLQTMTQSAGDHLNLPPAPIATSTLSTGLIPSTESKCPPRPQLPLLRR